MCSPSLWIIEPYLLKEPHGACRKHKQFWGTSLCTICPYDIRKFPASNGDEISSSFFFTRLSACAKYLVNLPLWRRRIKKMIWRCDGLEHVTSGSLGCDMQINFDWISRRKLGFLLVAQPWSRLYGCHVSVCFCSVVEIFAVPFFKLNLGYSTAPT